MAQGTTTAGITTPGTAPAATTAGDSVRNYFTEQLLTILVCGLFGFAAIQMWRNNMLEFLAPQFRNPVLYGGIGVLVLVALRAVAVWKEAGEMQAQLACGLDHVHGPTCNHVRIGDPDGDHEHTSDMSWVFARMLILVFPVLLFAFKLPSSASFSAEEQLRRAGNDSAIGAEVLKELAKDAEEVEKKQQPDGTTVRVLKTKTGLKIRETAPPSGGEPRLEVVREEGARMRFNDLNDAAFDEGKRNALAGETAILEGRFKRLGDKEFTLFRLKMTCCAADTVPLKVRIVVPQALSGFSDFNWVQVKGQIQFLKVPGQERYVPVIMVADITDVEKREPKNEYEQ
jgi:hypothetical protein